MKIRSGSRIKNINKPTFKKVFHLLRMWFFHIMNASELRIGNLLRDKVSKTELKVIELTEKNIVTYVIDRCRFPLQRGWALEPIPLTEEWLFKFGFDNKYNKGKFTIIPIGKLNYEQGRTYFNSWTILNHQPKYVHQLQNLYFALTSEELTLKQ